MNSYFQGITHAALSHEFTHFVEELSAEKFRKFTDVLFDVLGKSDVDVNRLIEAKEAVLRNTEEYKGRSEKELRAIAYSEVVAEMMEPVLTDTDAISRISQKIKQQDRSLWEKIKTFIRGIVEKLKSAYRDMEPDSAIARLTRETVTNSEAVLDAFSEAAADAVLNYNLQETAKENGLRYSEYTFTNRNGEPVDYLKSARITDKETLDFLNGQETVTTYKTMQLVDGKLYPPMAAVIQGSYEDASELGKWEMAVEHPELIKDVNGKAKFTLNKGKGQGSLAAAYNPYMHSSNLVLNDQFSGAYLRPNLVTVECKVPVSELTSGYKAQYAKDSVGWHSWHTGTVAGALRQQTGVERKVLLSRYIMPVRILSNAEVAGMYAELLNGTGIAVPDNVVPPALLAELEKAGVEIAESGRVKYSSKTGKKFSYQYFSQKQDVTITDIDADVGIDRKTIRNAGITSALNVGSRNKYGAVDVYVNDIGSNVVVGKDGISHGLRRENKGTPSENYIVAANAGPILKNSILINELTPKNENADGSYVLVGIAKDQYNTGYVVESIVNKFTNKLESMDVLYSMNAKKELAALNAPRATPEALPVTSSDYTVPSVLSLVKEHFPDILPEDVLKHYGYESRPDGKLGESVLYSSRDQQDSEYLNLAQNPEENELELKDMVRGAAEKAGFVYRRNSRQYHSPQNDVGWQMFVYGIDNDQPKAFGSYEFVATDEGAIPIEDVMPKLRELTEEFYGEPISDDEINPPDIIKSAGIFDDMEFMEFLYENYLNDLADENGGEYPAFITADGLMVFARDDKRVKSLAAVEYDDNGNVIPLSQRFDMGKEDIRYSARNPQAQVEAENERLKTELEYLKKLVQIQKRGNKDFTLDRNGLKKTARALMNANNAKGNVAELAEILDRVYRYAGTEPEITWESFAEQAGEAADWLMENRVKERDPYAQQILDAVAKRRVSLNEAQIGEIEYRYGSLSEFKKAIKGSIILDQNANTSLDQLWQELSGEYPGTFEAGTTDADMPGAFADIVDELRNSESANEAERQYYADEERNQLIRQVYDGYWDVDPVQSVSDKAKKEIDQLKAEHRKAIRELKAENRQLRNDAQSQIAEAVREYRRQQDVQSKAYKQMYERQLKEVQKGYEKFRSQAESLSSESTLRYQNEFYNALMGTENLGKAKVPELRKKFRELAVENSGKDMDARKARQAEYSRLLDEFLTSRDIGKLRTTIQEQRDRAKAKVEAARVTEQRGKLYRAVNEINRRLLNPTKTLYVPDSLAPAVTKFMQGLTEAMESPKNSWNVQGALETLQGQYQKLTQMNEGVFTQEYNQGILDLLDNAISAVGGTDFNKLSASQIEDVYSAVRSVLTAIRNENKMFAANLNKTYAEAAVAVLREESALPNRKPTTGAVQDKAEKFGWNQLKPVYAMMRLGSDTLLKQYNNLRAGEDKWQRVIAAARAYGLGIMAKYHYDQWNDSLMKLDTETGTVELSLEERMSLYAYARREQAFEHLTKGGFVLSDENTRTVKNRFGIKTEQI